MLVYARRRRRKARALRCQPCGAPCSPLLGAPKARRGSPDPLQEAIAFDGVDTPVSRQATRIFDWVDSPRTLRVRGSPAGSSQLRCASATLPDNAGSPLFHLTGQEDRGSLARPGRDHEALELHLVGRLLHGHRRALFLPVERPQSAGACHRLCTHSVTAVQARCVAWRLSFTSSGSVSRRTHASQLPAGRKVVALWTLLQPSPTNIHHRHRVPSLPFFPPKQVGACIVDPALQRIVGIGYNGFPIGCGDDVLPWARRGESALQTKYPYVCHAEMNVRTPHRRGLPGGVGAVGRRGKAWRDSECLGSWGWGWGL
jgi:hypothetical protein